MRFFNSKTLVVFYSGVLFFMLNVMLSSSMTMAEGGRGTEHATGWQGGARAQLRLIAGSATWLGQQRVLAGIEIKLAPKWKTYWRNPGDTGIPPEFDFRGSTNLKNAEVLYPFPTRFRDAGGLAIGYQARVIFPVLLEAVDPSQPIGLHLKANYAICYDLCIPVAASPSLEVIQPVDGPFGPALSLFLSDVPKPQKPGGGVGVRSVAFLKGAKGNKALQIDVALPPRSEEVDLFVEAEDGLYIPEPKRIDAVAGETAVAAFKIDLSGVDEPETLATVKLTCTLRIGEEAIVQPCNVR